MAAGAGAGGGTTGLLQTWVFCFACSSVASDNYLEKARPKQDSGWSWLLAAGGWFVTGGFLGAAVTWDLFRRYPVFWPRPRHCVSTGTRAGAV